MHGITISAVCFIIGGALGALGVDNRIAWGAVALAGLFMVVPI